MSRVAKVYTATAITAVVNVVLMAVLASVLSVTMNQASPFVVLATAIPLWTYVRHQRVASQRELAQTSAALMRETPAE